MSCGLPKDALIILNFLYRKHCLARDAGYNSKKLEHVISEKIDSKFDKIIKKLISDGYITQIPKRDIKYYISDINISTYALTEHGYLVAKGRGR